MLKKLNKQNLLLFKSYNKYNISLKELFDKEVDKIFIASSVEGVHYLRGEFVENNPINLKICKSIKKSKFAWYPDNIGKPAITFVGCDVQWVYDNIEDRDREWNQLIKIQLKD